jgi:hypothetical protein
MSERTGLGIVEFAILEAVPWPISRTKRQSERARSADSSASPGEILPPSSNGTFSGMYLASTPPCPSRFPGPCRS